MVVNFNGNPVAIMLGGTVQYLPAASEELTAEQRATARSAYLEGRSEVSL
jgi:hypothetical protein